MEERIKYLFKQYLENKCSRKEFDEFFDLLRYAEQDETIRSLVQKAYSETGHNSVTYVDETGNLILPEPEWLEKPVQEMDKPEKKRNLSRLGMIAAAAVIAAISWWQWGGNAAKIMAGNEMEIQSTEKSEFRFLLLPDSTQVFLNAASSIEYSPEFGIAKREVFLSGEAYFDVKNAEKLPFIIHTGKISTTVLGTAFNIKAYDNLSNVTVAVSRGKVKVQYLDTVLATLSTGQQIKVNNNGAGITERKSGLKQVATWQQGNLVYEDETVADIISDLERIYNVSIVVTNITVSNMRISTSLNKQSGVEQAIQIICKVTDSKMVQEGGKYFIH